MNIAKEFSNKFGEMIEMVEGFKEMAPILEEMLYEIKEIRRALAANGAEGNVPAD